MKGGKPFLFTVDVFIWSYLDGFI